METYIFEYTYILWCLLFTNDTIRIVVYHAAVTKQQVYRSIAHSNVMLQCFNISIFLYIDMIHDGVSTQTSNRMSANTKRSKKVRSLLNIHVFAWVFLSWGIKHASGIKWCLNEKMNIHDRSRSKCGKTIPNGLKNNNTTHTFYLSATNFFLRAVNRSSRAMLPPHNTMPTRLCPSFWNSSERATATPVPALISMASFMRVYLPISVWVQCESQSEDENARGVWANQRTRMHCHGSDRRRQGLRHSPLITQLSVYLSHWSQLCMP